MHGPKDPEVATILSHLGTLLRGAKELTGARAVLEEALEIRDGALGPSHPLVTASLDELAGVLTEQGQYASALPLRRRCVELQAAQVCVCEVCLTA